MIAGRVLAAVPARSVTPDRARNRWPWVVGGAFGGLAVHTSFAWGRSRLLAVAGCVVGFAITKVLEWRMIRTASGSPVTGRKTLVLTPTHLAIVPGRVIGDRTADPVATVPITEVDSIRVENVGRRWKRAVGFATVAVVFVSEFVVISQNVLLLGAIFAAVIIALVGVATTSDVWIRITGGRQWKVNVPASDWLDFYPLVPGFKWRGSGDGAPLDGETDTESLIGYPNR